METITECPVCSGNNLKPFLKCIDYTVSRETFDLISCENCSLIATSPRPELNCLNRYYQSKSYISHSSQPSTIVDKLYLFARRFTLKQKRNLISKYSTDTNTILDYGCGTGQFLHVCKSSGWETFGVEPSAVARKKASELLKQNIFEHLPDETKRYGIITLWHVLEHIPDFQDTLAKLKAAAIEDATIFIAIPNPASYDAKKYKEHWAAYDVPRHLWHFKRNNFEKLMSKHSLKVIDIIPMKLDAYYVSLLSEKNLNGNKLTLNGLVNALTTASLSNLKAMRSGEYSSLIYVIKK